MKKKSLVGWTGKHMINWMRFEELELHMPPIYKRALKGVPQYIKVRITIEEIK